MDAVGGLEDVAAPETACPRWNLHPGLPTKSQISALDVAEEPHWC